MRRQPIVIGILLAAGVLVGCAGPQEPSAAGGQVAPTTAGGISDALVEQALAYEPPASYLLELEVTCFCPVTRFRVTVEDGEVVQANAIGPTGQPTDAPVPGFAALSISQLQDRLEEVWRGEGIVTRLELGGDGLPVVVGLDPLPDAVDDEATYQVLDVVTE